MCVCVCVSIWLCVRSVQHTVCIYCWGVRRSWYSVTDSRRTSKTVRPTWQHSLSNHVDSCRLSQLLEDDPETPQPHKSTGITYQHPNLSSLQRREEEKRKAEKRRRAVQLSLCLAFSFLFSSSHLKLWDTHLSLIAHQHSTHEKVLWICINTAYGSSSAGTRCVQKGRVLPMHYSPFKLPQ